jgi:hypothetical protein
MLCRAPPRALRRASDCVGLGRIGATRAYPKKGMTMHGVLKYNASMSEFCPPCVMNRSATVSRILSWSTKLCSRKLTGGWPENPASVDRTCTHVRDCSEMD